MWGRSRWGSCQMQVGPGCHLSGSIGDALQYRGARRPQKARRIQWDTAGSEIPHVGTGLAEPTGILGASGCSRGGIRHRLPMSVSLSSSHRPLGSVSASVLSPLQPSPFSFCPNLFQLIRNPESPTTQAVAFTRESSSQTHLLTTPNSQTILGFSWS